MEKARVIITLECNRSCEYCVNKNRHILERAVKIKSINELKEHRIICVTGGEPMLNPERSIGIIKAIRKKFPESLLYFYTALFNERIKEIIRLVDGISYTLHKKYSQNDIQNFYKFQKLIDVPGKEFHLNLDPAIRAAILIRPFLWSNIKIKKWFVGKEAHIPEGELLYILNPG